jgi:hypothetical protein
MTPQEERPGSALVALSVLIVVVTILWLVFAAFFAEGGIA